MAERNWGNRSELSLVHSELQRRDSKSAKALRAKVMSRIAGLDEPHLVNKTSAGQDEASIIEDKVETGSTQNAEVRIECDTAGKIGFVSQQNAVAPVRSIAIVNDTTDVLEELTLTLSSDPPFLAERKWNIDRIAHGESLNLLDRRVDIHAGYTKGLTESERGVATFVLINGEGDVIARHEEPIELLAADQWGGTRAMTELLPAFVMPNDPAVDRLLKSASDTLRRAGRSGNIDGYDAGERTRVYELASAIWTAVADLELSYAMPPASFERDGQKIRTPAAILNGRLATCLDTALLFAAAMEQASLNALIVLTEGHAFVGCWLQPQEFANLVTDDVAAVRTRLDLDELILFETTMVAQNPPTRFSDAVAEAKRQVGALEIGDVFTALDIKRARMQKLLPLATHDKATGEDEVEAGKNGALELAPAAMPKSFDLSQIEEEEGAADADRIVDWQRKLLDLTARNRLLNLPKRGTVLEFVCPEPAKLEDILADQKDIRIKPLPDLAVGGRDVELHRQRSHEDLANEHAISGLDRGELYVKLEQKALDAALIKLYRTAKADMDEGGSNTLYLALGFLEWKKNAGDQRSYRAPLILLPVRLKRRSARADMKLAVHTDDARFNMTLLELLKTDFGLNIAGLDGDLPTDESGIDVAGVWNHIRHAIKDSAGFEVREEVVLGIFSFSKYLMWKDLVDRADQLKNNPVVRHLIERGSESFAQSMDGEGDGMGERPPMARPETLDAELDPKDLYAPLPADSSQLAAVVASGQGYNFVLDGPPGTGKSQTIANMISHNLALGRRVLFVSEKRAALDVVYRRLEAIGLGDFCLELHSHKSSKAEVLRQLGEAWGARGALSPDEWQHETARLKELRDGLNAFASALHKTYPNAMTVHDAVWRSLRDDGAQVPIMRWAPGTEHSRAQLDEMRQSVRNLELTHEALRAVDRVVSESIGAKEWNNAWQAHVLSAAKALRGSLIALQENGQAAIEATGLPLAYNTPASVQLLAGCVSDTCGLADSHVAFAFEADHREKTRALREYAQVLRSYQSARGSLSVPYAVDAERNVDRASLSFDWEAADERFWFLETLARRRVVRSLADSGGTTGQPDPDVDLPILATMSAHRDSCEALQAPLKELPGFAGLSSNPDRLESMAEDAQALRSMIAKHSQGVEGFTQLSQAVRSMIIDANDMLVPGGSIHTASERLEKAISDWSQAHDKYQHVAKVAPKGETFGELDDTMRKLDESQLSLRALCQWNAVRTEAASKGLDPIADLIENGLPEGSAVPLFETAYAKWFATWTIDAEPLLAGFNSRLHEDAIVRFREHTQHIQDLTSRIVRGRLCANLPDRAEVGRSSGYGILKHELAKQRRHKPVRQLAEEMGSDFSALAPCMLMSPLSIAQYLPATQDLFDIVIFDEASQITPWDAVGSIARGKQLVLAGDDKQMPPTNFFSKGSATVDDDMITDLDSILEECQGAGIPKRSLDWHYRSRHDSLIAFSNSRYYGNKLVTFPPPQTRESAVKWRKIESVYAKGSGQTNPGEAKAIVAEVVARLRNSTPGNETLGVVTLNSQQQELIQDLLETERRKDVKFDAHFADALEEPVFVKNLETVQGDERDTIILGTTFGPTEPGAEKMSMNFGPLNRDGGERRLNVAITRARKDMLLFTSFDAGMIDLSKTGANAIRDLKHYIEFAAKGPKALAEAHQGSVGATESPFEDAVKAMLEVRGWTVRPQIGVSGFRIDLGVVHPDRPGDYLAGIECDGAMYHSALTARDRDQVRQAVLEGLGWDIIRIWSTDFWINAEAAMDIVDARMQELLETGRALVTASEEAKASSSNVEDGKASLAPTASNEGRPNEKADHPASRDLVSTGEDDIAAAEVPDGKDGVVPLATPEITQLASSANVQSVLPPQPYQQAELGLFSDEIDPDTFFESAYDDVLRRMIVAVLEVEAPLPKSVLATSVARAHGFKRTGSAILERVEVLARELAMFRKDRDGTNIIWRDEAHHASLEAWRIPDGGDHKRAIDDIPEAELRLCAAWVSDNDDVPREVARMFGFSRLRAPSRARIVAAVGLDLIDD